jgi:uncharacterized protein (TIGR03437 family)
MSRRLALFLAACTGLFISTLQADDIAALPGYNSPGSNVAVFGGVNSSSLTSLGSFTAGDSTFLILPKPDGSKYYVIAKSTTNAVTTVDTNFENPNVIGSFVTSPSAAAITPDGTKLVVAAGTLHIFETTKDQELVPGGINTQYTIIDVALSLDGKTAYALGTSTSGGFHVNAINLATNSIGSAQYGNNGAATGVAVGPNGLVYVSFQNEVVELDPTTLQPTLSGGINMDARPGKVVFTPDGKYALAVNQQPVDGSVILIINLAAHTYTIIPTSYAPNVVFDTLLVPSSTTVYAYSSQSLELFQLGISTQNSTTFGPASIAGVPSTSVQGVAISNEVPFAGRTTAQYLFVASSGTLYRIDLTIQQQTASTALPTLPNDTFTALEYLALATTGSPAALLGYGNNQIIAPNATSEPLVVQALDVNGKPLSGATITFSTNLGILTNTSVTTGANGYASTVLKAPGTSGVTANVTATNGKLQSVFTISVTTVTGPPSGNMKIVAGQGQLLPDSTNSGLAGFGSPLTVMVTDLNGNAVSGAAVVFAVSPGASAGSLEPINGGASAPTLTVHTDANGLASIGYLTDAIAPLSPFVESSITASSTGTAGVTFYETTYSSADGNSTAPSVTPESPQSGTTLIGQAGTTIVNAFSAIIAAPNGAVPNVSVRTCQLVPPAGVGLPPTCNVPPANTIPFGTCADPEGPGSLSNSKGFVHCDLVLNGVVGKSTIAPQYGYANFEPAVQLEIIPGPPGEIKLVQGNNQTGKPGVQLPVALVVQITDSFGNIVPNTPVTWAVLSSGAPATLQQTSPATESTGSASTLVTLGSTVGVVIVQVTAGNQTAEFTLTVASTAASILPVSGNNQSTFVSTAFAAPLIVKVVDNLGNGVPGAPVTFTVASGSAVVATPSTTTDPTGAASTAVTAGATPGNISIVATSGSFTTTFTLVAGLVGPTNIVFVNGTNFQLQNGCPPPGCVAPGEIVTVEGGGFANGVQGVVSGLSILGPLQTSLAGVSITFNGVAAPIFYVSNVNGVQSMTIQVPFETPLGNTTVMLTPAGGGPPTPLNVTTQPYAPGVFTNTYGNVTIAVAVRSDGSYVSPTNPAHRGETIYVFATGLGLTTPAAVTNEPGAGQSVTATVVVGLNNKGVAHTTVDYAPGLVGVYIIGVQVPANTTPGPGQPFGLILVDPSGNKYFAQSTKIPIE